MLKVKPTFNLNANANQLSKIKFLDKNLNIHFMIPKWKKEIPFDMQGR